MESPNYLSALSHVLESYPEEYALFLSQHALFQEEQTAEQFLSEYEAETN